MHAEKIHFLKTNKLNKNEGINKLNPGTKSRWTLNEIENLYEQPFMELIFNAHQIHKTYHDPHSVQLSTLLSVKTGGCPEDCSYCPQAQRYQTGVKAQKLLELNEVKANAEKAKAAGATRFC